LTGATDGFTGWLDATLAMAGVRISLNQGAPTISAANAAEYYMDDAMNAPGGLRKWGPSSEHSGQVVVHLYCDGHVGTIAQDINKNAYLRIITRSGAEPAPAEL
jgi:hypothetical protein